MTTDIMLGDCYLLCSDGLSDMLKDENISAILSEGGEANELCEAAIAHGGLDNVSCCVIKI